MNAKNNLGRRGEQVAVEYLERAGFIAQRPCLRKLADRAHIGHISYWAASAPGAAQAASTAARVRSSWSGITCP